MTPPKQVEVNQFWKNVWITRQSRGENPNFHDHKVKPFLKEYLAVYQKEKLHPILIPFCGKSIDMLWLQQQGYHVIGVELSDEASDAFFKENGLVFKKEEDGDFIVKTAETSTGSLTILCGDILQLQPKHLQAVRLVYDRAGYNSVPLELRQNYAELFTTHLLKGTKILFGVLDFEGQEPKSGPPYFISEEELSPLRSMFDVTVHAEKRADYFFSPIKQVEGIKAIIEPESQQAQAINDQALSLINILRLLSRMLSVSNKLPTVPQGYVDVPGDGLCFYHAVAQQLGGNLYGALELQQMAINEVVNHLDRYEGFVAQGDGLNGLLNYHLQRQESEKGGWADNIMVQALANALGRIIEVQLFDLQGNAIGYAPPIIPYNNPADPNGLRIGNIANLHFVAADNINGPIKAGSDGGAAANAHGQLDDEGKIRDEGEEEIDWDQYKCEVSVPTPVPTPAPTVISVSNSVPTPNATSQVYYEVIEFGDASSFEFGAVLTLNGIDSALNNPN